MTITLTLPFIILAIIDIAIFIYAVTRKGYDGMFGSIRFWAIIMWFVFSLIAWIIYGGIYWW